jgi:hypothetical protein
MQFWFLVAEVKLRVIFAQYLEVSTRLCEVWLVLNSCDVWYCQQNSQGLMFDEIKLSFTEQGINNIISVEMKIVFCLIILQVTAYPMC